MRVFYRDQVALGELKDKWQNNKTDDTRLEATAKNCWYSLGGSICLPVGFQKLHRSYFHEFMESIDFCARRFCLYTRLNGQGCEHKKRPPKKNIYDKLAIPLNWEAIQIDGN